MVQFTKMIQDIQFLKKNRIHFIGKDRNGILLFIHNEHGGNVPIESTLQERLHPEEKAIEFRIVFIKWIS